MVPNALQRDWLRRFSIRLSSQLAATLPKHAVRLQQTKDLRPEASDTDGWYVTLGTIRGQPGSYVDVWFDDWTKAGERRIAFCLSARTSPRLEDVVNKIKLEFGKFKILRDNNWQKDPDGQARLKSPLPQALFGKPIVELYRQRGSWSFLSLFHPRRPDFEDPSDKFLISDGVSFYTKVVLALIGARSAKNQIEFPDLVNRVLVRRHKVWERSALAARAAKIRDSYTCKVCGFNFAQHYGKLGEDFAEAHHVVPLARLQLGARIREEDLRTVCANCHRMLHRMSGRRSDIVKLRQLLADAEEKND